MTSFNIVDYIPATANRWLIDDVLRKQWGWDGFVVTDYGAIAEIIKHGLGDLSQASVLALKAGTDMDMCSEGFINTLEQSLKEGKVTMAEIDQACRRVLEAKYKLGLFDNPYRFLDKKRRAKDIYTPEHRKAARELAAESFVLLKNEGALPLKGGKKNSVVILGPMLDIMPCGGGSGEVHPIDGRSITIKDAVSKLDAKKFDITCLEPSFGSYDRGAIRKASAVVVAVGFTKKTEGEGHDRLFTLPEGQDALIEMALENNKNVIVVVVSGGEVDMSRWHDRASAILMTWYDGQDLGSAVTAILTGQVAPSGKLPFTVWGTLENNPTYASYHPTMTAFNAKKGTRHAARFERYQYTEYAEGVFMGYRGVEHFGHTPLYPFGYGLSYTTFDYTDLAVTPAGDGFDVSFTVRNTGGVNAKEVAEVYVAPIEPKILRPARELKEYQKVFVPKGGSASVKVHLDLRAFSFYDANLHDWAFDSGKYRIEVGRSSADIVLSQEVTL